MRMVDDCRQLPTIADDCRLFRAISEDLRRQRTTADDCRGLPTTDLMVALTFHWLTSGWRTSQAAAQEQFHGLSCSVMRCRLAHGMEPSSSALRLLYGSKRSVSVMALASADDRSARRLWLTSSSVRLVERPPSDRGRNSPILLLASTSLARDDRLRQRSSPMLTMRLEERSMHSSCVSPLLPTSVKSGSSLSRLYDRSRKPRRGSSANAPRFSV